MKKLVLLTALTTSLSFPAFSQENKELSGKIIAPNLEESTVHIINITQRTGTVNATSGNFKILARQNDTLLFSSIQYENIRIPVTAEVLNLENFTVELTEDVNELAEVNISNIGLTGNLSTDLANIEKAKDPLFSINLGDLKNARFEADINDPLMKPVHLASKQNDIRYGEEIFSLSFDLARIGNLFRNKRTSTSSPPAVVASVEIRRLFEDEFFTTSLGIKEEHIKDFIFSLDTIALPQQLFKPEKRLALIDLLIAQGKIYAEGINPEKTVDQHEPLPKHPTPTGSQELTQSHY